MSRRTKRKSTRAPRHARRGPFKWLGDVLESAIDAITSIWR